MPTLITHLRVAERLLEHFEFATAPFLIGSVAPDCRPQPQIEQTLQPTIAQTHWHDANGQIRPQRFYEHYFLEATELDQTQMAFFAGYYVHLLTDRIWAHFYQLKKQQYSAYHEGIDLNFALELARDWVALDRHYLQAHPASLFFTTFQYLESVPDYLALFPAGALADHVRYNIQHYLKHTPKLERAFAYLTQQELDRFITAATEASVKILSDKIPDPVTTSKASTSRGRKASVQPSAKAETPGPLVIEPALALLEFSSIAAGIQSADSLVKRAALAVIHAGTVQPGRFLVLIGGEVAEVEEALKAGLETASDALTDHVFLPGVHGDVVRALAGGREIGQTQDALGIIETHNVPAAIHAADKGIKGANVTLMEIRLADGLGGKGIVFFTGAVSDVEAAIELATAALSTGQLVRQVVISQLHEDMAAVLRANTRFGVHLGWSESRDW